MDTRIGAKEHRRELLVVLVMTVIGGLLRVWSPGTLGLIHFDEGIYALAGLWPLSPKGFWGIDPTVIAYAPGGYPFLVGLGSFVLGFGDLTPILVSVLMGTLTIPLVAWLSWRTFGPTAGAITATFAAFSGFHIAFSRMALTDVSFLFFFILALGLGQRFLERPNLINTIAMGLGVGLAQWFKYHGWLAGGIVALTAAVNAILTPSERTPRRLARVWGQGACAALIAFAVFWPWFSFVESHGGYADLIRHHASYMQGAETWLLHLLSQLDQVTILDQSLERERNWPLRVPVIFAAICVLSDELRTARKTRNRILYSVGFVTVAWLTVAVPVIGWWLGAMLPGSFRARSPRVLLIGFWWLILSVTTPFYHPYARLWLPLEACRWIVIGCFVSRIIAFVRFQSQSLHFDDKAWGRQLAGWCIVAWSAVFCAFMIFHEAYRYHRAIDPQVRSRSDSLRIACRQIQADLPKDLKRLRFLGRPPITFYLGTAGVALAPHPDLDALLKPGPTNDWTLVDHALLRQRPDLVPAKARLMESWDLVHEYPTTLNLPSFLDIDPGAARGKIEPSMLECPLWLLRPRVNGTK